MDALPSQPLLDTLAGLKLAQPDEVARVASRARRLARDLASFDLAWIDALKQAALLTPWQAEQLQHGRAGRLTVGPFVLFAPLASLGWARAYRGRCRTTGAWCQVYVAAIDLARREQLAADLAQLVVACQPLDARYSLPVVEAGVDAGDQANGCRVWAATEDTTAKRAHHWMAANGRFSAAQVLEIARQSAAAAAHLQSHNLLHGDLTTANVLIDAQGQVRLAVPGLRIVLRPREGFAHADLPPDSYDTLPPERIEPSGPASWESEAYSLASVWWQMLAGRAPFAGGDSLTKLRNLHRARWLNIALYAPDTDPRLIAAIKQLTAIAAPERMSDFNRIATELGESTSTGRSGLAQAMRDSPAPLRWRRQSRQSTRYETFPWSLGFVVLLAVLVGVGWPMWKNFRAHSSQPLAAQTSVVLQPETLAAPTGAPPLPQGEDARPAISADSTTPAIVDAAVTTASFEQVAPLELLLATDRPNAWPTERLAADTVVRPRGEGRATVRVPAKGIAIDVPGLEFRQIDFVASEGATLIRLAAPRVTFVGCSFRGGTADVERGPTSAIRWQDCTGQSASPAPAVARLRLENCHFHALASAIAIEHASTVECELHNTLVTSCESAFRWHRFPATNATIQIRLAHATVRDVGRMVVFADDAESGGDPASLIALTVDDSIIDLGPATAVMEVQAAQPPLRMLQQFDWSGAGSMLNGDVPLMLWNDGEMSRIVKESQLSVDGLARTRVKFVGDNLRDPAASVAVDWYAPRIAAEPPGIDGVLLPAVATDQAATDSADWQFRP